MTVYAWLWACIRGLLLDCCKLGIIGEMGMLMGAQIRGRKRLLLWPPSALHQLQPYPSWHILRRRCRFDPAKPDLKRFPNFDQVCLATTTKALP